ncbi:MAG: AMP-binding protein [Austwickia sp.]|nr:AMP-binding protein [Austwickia sp.]
MPDLHPQYPDVPAWERAAALVDWDVRPTQLWQPGPQGGRWFVDGELSVARNLLDRHARAAPERVAIRWQGEPGDERTVTYRDLLADAVALAGALRALGVGDTDLVALHLGSLPETVVAMMACTRIGARYAIIPTPLPVDGLIDRLEALSPRVLFTQDGAWRHGMVVPLKSRVDEALSAIGGVEHTVVVRRTGMDVAWFEGDRWYHEILDAARFSDSEAATAGHFPAEHPVLVAGLPRRGDQPVTAALGAGAVIAAAAMHRYGFTAGEVTWCVGAMAWPGTIVHGVLGPLAMGGTIVLAEGTIDRPAHTRVWDLLNRHRVSTLIAVPTVLRQLRTWALEVMPPPEAPDLQRIVTIGEQVDPQLRAWIAEHLVGHPVSTGDAWGQVELGGAVRIDHPVEQGLLPDPGLVIVDEWGVPVPEGAVGEAVLTRPWAGSMLTDRTHGHPVSANWHRDPRWFSSGDLCRRTREGGIEFLGRIDHVVSVSGQLVSLGEVRSLLLDHPYTVAVDVLERVRLGGSRYVAAAVVLDPAAVGERDVQAVFGELNRSVREVLGGLACPSVYLIVDRCGDELRGDERRRALARLAVSERDSIVRVSWEDVVTTYHQLGEPGQRYG